MHLWTAFVLGLIGSLHCAGMCGPLALALPHTSASTSGHVLGRVTYNLGRIATYCVLGLAFGLFGQGLSFAGVQRWASIGLGIVLLAGLFASRKLALSLPVTSLVTRLKSGMTGLLRRRSLASLAVLGLLNGLLPCGLVYVACAGAVTTGNLFTGALYMTAFGMGTIPMMLAIGIFGRLLPLGFRLKLTAAIPASVFLLALLLILRGMALDIPYLSPDLSSPTPACCSIPTAE